jgi:hypothetical protein
MRDDNQALLDINDQESLANNEDGSLEGAIREAKSSIVDLWHESADNSFEIGECLLFLHESLTSEEFSEYMSNDLTDLGISRSTGYRWLVLAAKLEDLFPNYLIVEALMRLTGGRGIFADFRLRDNAPANVAEPDPSETPLTTAAREALAGLRVPPQVEQCDEKAIEWVKSFIRAMNRIRARQRAEKCAAGKTAATQGESLLRKLKDFAADFGAEEFEKFREQMDRFFGPRNNGTKAEGQATSAGVPSNVETQSQLKTESEAGTPSVRASHSQLVPLGLRPTNVDEKSVGLTNVFGPETEPASAGAKAIRPVAQSQLGTENLPPEVQAKTPTPVSAPNAVNQPSNKKDHAQGGIASAPASPSVVAAAKPPQSQVGPGTANPSLAQAQAVPGAAPDTIVHQNNVRQNLIHPNKEQVRSGVPSAPLPQNAVSAAKPAQS